jgi:hypothetical protein
MGTLKISKSKVPAGTIIKPTATWKRPKETPAPKVAQTPTYVEDPDDDYVVPPHGWCYVCEQRIDPNDEKVERGVGLMRHEDCGIGSDQWEHSRVKRLRDKGVKFPPPASACEEEGEDA